ncbi:MAG: hypothetical protein H6704_07060 [Myxococcales bacterium]|nr:hypothetical protein [Myxococcales bacterium]
MCASLVAVSGPAGAQTLVYEGRLTEPNGVVRCPAMLSARIGDEEIEADLGVEAVRCDPEEDDGRFSASLSCPNAALCARATWIEIGEGEVRFPRQDIGAVPTALGLATAAGRWDADALLARLDALEARALPEDCAAGDTLVRAAAGWRCAPPDSVRMAPGEIRVSPEPRADEFASLAQALASLEGRHVPPQGTTIQIADGTYPPDGQPAASEPIFIDHPDGARLRIEGNPNFPERVVFRFRDSSGLVVAPGQALGGLRGVTLRSENPEPTIGEIGLSSAGGWIAASRVAVEGFYNLVSATDNGVVIATDSAFQDGGGTSIGAAWGGRVSIDDSTVVRGRGNAIGTAQGGLVSAARVVVTDAGRAGVEALGGFAYVGDARIDGPEADGVQAGGGGVILAEGLTVTDAGNYAVIATAGGLVSVSRLTVDGASRGVGASTRGAVVGADVTIGGTTAVAAKADSSATIHFTRATYTPAGGICFDANQGAVISPGGACEGAESFGIVCNPDLGYLATGAGASCFP